MKTKELSDYNGLGRALEVSDGTYTLVITLDIGPRILRFSRVDGQNILEENVQQTLQLPDGKEWRLYGGHRVWHGPESFPRTYLSDSVPVEKVETVDNGIAVWQKEEPWTHLVKGLQVIFQDDRIEVRSRVANAGAWPVEISAWAITVLSRGGQAICPMVRDDTGLLPNACYVTWPYTRLNDPRLKWGEKYFRLDQDPVQKEELKIGYPNTLGWAVYLNKGLCFQKRYQHIKGANYPDYGSSFECFIADWGLEMETLSPLTLVQPGQTLDHVEWWRLENMPEPCPVTELEIDRMIDALSMG
jgi:hypothetical protein